MNPGTRLGPYEIVAPLGAGGMGEVYEARDTRLDRSVAVKVLPAYIAAREDMRARFEREARAVASLNHPNICVLHDVGKHEGTDYIVMEHLAGETLANRLERDALPVDQALKYAMQIADAVDRAHRTGVVHRDLKPANVMITRDGAKVLDFGLAKTATKAAAAADGATMTVAITGEGTVLGTPQYMSPEQNEGVEADSRTDIFAFGCVLYEMVTGKRAFDGKTRGSVIGAILSVDPAPVSSLQPLTPLALDGVVARCLAKDPEERYQSLRDVLLDLRAVGTASPEAAKAPRKLTWLPWTVAAMSVTLAAVVAALWMRQPAPEAPSLRFTLGSGRETDVGPQSAASVSPDGRMVVFSGADKNGITQSLWMRSLDSLEARPLAATGRGGLPFWSPDSKSVAYFSQGKLWRTEIAGGPPTLLCNATYAIGGGAWSRSGILAFGGGSGLGLLQVPAQGGVVTPLTTVDTSRGEMAHRFPVFLPDGRRFLYTIMGGNPETSGVFLGSMDDPRQRKKILGATSNVRYAPPSGRHPAHLLWVRERSLVAQTIHPGSMVLYGDPIPIISDVGVAVTQAGPTAFSLSDTGTIALRKGGTTELTIAWLHRDGKREEVGVPKGAYGFLNISPDGERVAFRQGEVGANWDLWTFDFRRAKMTRLTFDPSTEGYPVWSPDGRQIAYSANRDGSSDVFVRDADGGGAEKRLTREAGLKATLDWSRDGRFILYRNTGDSGSELKAVPLDGGKPLSALKASRNSGAGKFSPDGRWLAYTSNETGRLEVYVEAFPPTGARWQVTTNGGAYPTWKHDGSELFFLSDSQLFSVPVRSGPRGPDIGAARAEVKYDSPTGLLYPYDVTRDGKRFLVLEPTSREGAELVVISNWQAGLKQ